MKARRIRWTALLRRSTHAVAQRRRWSRCFFNEKHKQNPPRLNPAGLYPQCGPAFAAQAANPLGATNLVAGPGAGSASVGLNATGPWNVSTGTAWLHASQSGIGAGIAVFSFDALWMQRPRPRPPLLAVMSCQWSCRARKI